MASKAKGLGDSIEQFTEATGIKSLVHKIFGDCGCEERKILLNKLFPYHTECLEESEYNFLSTFNFDKQTLEPVEQVELLKIYNRVFNQQNQMTSCRACWVSILNNLRTLYNEYNK